MKVNRIRQNVFPVLAAMIWGTSFVAQSVSADYVQPFTFNAIRSAVAFLFLLGLIAVQKGIRKRKSEAEPAVSGTWKDLSSTLTLRVLVMFLFNVNSAIVFSLYGIRPLDMSQYVAA